MDETQPLYHLLNLPKPPTTTQARGTPLETLSLAPFLGWSGGARRLGKGVACAAGRGLGPQRAVEHDCVRAVPPLSAPGGAAPATRVARRAGRASGRPKTKRSGARLLAGGYG